MRLLVIGATRGIGLETLKLGLESGHEMTALVRNGAALPLEGDGLSVIQGDILDARSVEEAVSDRDAVIVTIGIRPTREAVTVFSEGTRNVVAAMEKKGCNRLLCVTGIGAGDSRGHGGFFYDKIINPLLLARIYEDKDRQEAVVRESSLAWTIVRPGFLTNGRRTGSYRVIENMEGVRAKKISRADVADFLLKEAEENEHVSGTVLLTY